MAAYIHTKHGNQRDALRCEVTEFQISKINAIACMSQDQVFESVHLCQGHDTTDIELVQLEVESSAARRHS